jgi:hypothetical protein
MSAAPALRAAADAGRYPASAMTPPGDALLRNLFELTDIENADVADHQAMKLLPYGG